MGQDIPNDDFIYEDGSVGYCIRYDSGDELCYVGYDELCDYEVGKLFLIYICPLGDCALILNLVHVAFITIGAFRSTCACSHLSINFSRGH